MTKARINRLFASAVISLFLSILAAQSLLAIPAFARKYRMSCKTCHVAAPKLKPYGDDFAANGFELTDQENARYFVDTGDDMLSLIREFPIAARIDGFLTYNDYAGKKVDFDAPWVIKILSGGRLADHLAYYFYFLMNERGEVAGVEDAYVMFNNLLGADFDIYLGQFQLCDPLFKRETRLTYEDYQIYKTAPGLSGINLEYDRGLMFTFGAPGGPDLVLEVVNGNGIGEADESRNYDSDKYKNFLGRISQDIGKHFRLGAFAFTGRERMNGNVNSAWMAGPDATVDFSGKAELNLQYIERRDDNPFFLAGDPPEIKTRGGFAELVLMPRGDESRVFPALVWNRVDSGQDDLDYHSLSFHLTYMLRRNFRLTGEFGREFEKENNRLGFGFVSAF